jgi:integrase
LPGYTLQYFDENGKRRKESARCADLDTARQIAARRETAVLLRKKGIVDVRQERLAAEGGLPIAKHLADFEAKMQAEGRTRLHVASTLSYIRAVCEAAGFGAVSDIGADGVNRYAQTLRGKRSARTVQSHLTAMKSFSKWLTIHGKLPADPLASVRKPNPKAARRRERRMLLPDEWSWLRGVTLADGAKRYGMTAVERVLLYAVAIQTGLRAGELRSLTRGGLFLESDPPYVTCKAGSTKNSKDARQYIQADVADELRAHIARKAPGASVFEMPTKDNAASMLRQDLDAARRNWLQAVRHDPEETARRRESDFLSEQNHEGEHLDFHSLRHTCGAWAAMTGAHPKAVQSLMRHSAITLTMDTYGHLFPGQEADTVARLPGMLGDAPEALAATGTDHARADAVGDMPPANCNIRGQFRGQLSGETYQNGASLGGRTDATPEAESDDGDGKHSVLPLCFVAASAAMR